MKHAEFKAKLLNNPEVKQQYDELEDEFSLFEEMSKARQAAGLTQEEVAERMGTKASAVARLESSGGKKHHSPSLVTLQKYAKAIGYNLEIRLHPRIT